VEFLPRQDNRDDLEPEKSNRSGVDLNITISPTRAIAGELTAPPSKAQTHRALFTALLARGSTTIIHPLQCDDTKATEKAVMALGARSKLGSGILTVSSNGALQRPRGIIDCGESGVTMRFVIPILSLLEDEAVLTAEESLIRRPIEPLAEALKQLNVSLRIKGRKITVSGGPAEGGTVTVRGDVSSQFISGLLLAGTLMRKGIKLEVVSPLESRKYVLMTIETLRRHGVNVNVSRDFSLFELPGGQKPKPTTHEISGDYSSASYLLCAAAITGSSLTVKNLSQTLEPDSIIVNILSQMGVGISVVEDRVIVDGGKLKAIDVDIRECPDLGPIMAAIACYAVGETRITGARRLRYKESDRLASMRSELLSLGGEVIEAENGLTLKGPIALNGGIVQTHNDHRIAMALAIAALGAKNEITIQGAECVNKSYPNFFEDLRSIGVEVVG
jgi:3-phosphoshikimate 1-carboxyvinyltransferase